MVNSTSLRDPHENLTLHTRRTKIVATLGPASNCFKVFRSLAVAGANVFRMNFSHGTHDGHSKVHQAIRSVEQELGRPIAILADLQGPKLRVGGFVAGIAPQLISMRSVPFRML